MKLIALSKPVVVILATAVPALLLTGGAPLAKKPGADVDCMVGTDAFPTIQSAVNVPGCITIGVPAGTFRENVTINAAGLTHTRITIRGAGPERTTVDGSGQSGATFAIGGPAGRQPCDPPVVVVTVEGMRITGGTGPICTPQNPNCQRNGGGVSASPGVKLTVNNCIVTGNSAYMNGGGISVPNGRLTVVDSVVSHNTAHANPQPGNTNPDYVGGGGGLRIAGCPSVLIVKGSVIRDNVSYRHGGGILSFVSTPMMVGGGVSIPGPDGTLVAVDSDLKHNTAAEARGGGGIYHVRTDLTVLDSKIGNNYPDDVRQGANP